MDKTSIVLAQAPRNITTVDQADRNANAINRLFTADVNTNFVHRTRLYQRLSAHLSNSGLSLEETPVGPLVKHCQFLNGTVATAAGAIKIAVHFQHLTIIGLPEALVFFGVCPDWLPGSPLQLKTSGKATAVFIGAERKIKLRRENRKVCMSVGCDEQESDQLRDLRKAEAAAERNRVSLLNSQRQVRRSIDAMPASGDAFRERQVQTMQALMKGLAATASLSIGGYSLDPDDLSDFRMALGDTLNALRQASVRFDAQKREEHILKIIDDNIDAALPLTDRAEVNHG